MFRITKILLNKNNIYLINLLEYQKMGINLKIMETNCELDKFFLHQEKLKINEIQQKIQCGYMTNIEIKDFINNIHNYKKN